MGGDASRMSASGEFVDASGELLYASGMSVSTGRGMVATHVDERESGDGAIFMSSRGESEWKQWISSMLSVGTLLETSRPSTVLVGVSTMSTLLRT